MLPSRAQTTTFRLITGAYLKIVLLVMTRTSLEFLLKLLVKPGGDVGIAVGTVGAFAKAQTSDRIAYSRSKGLYDRINVEFISFHGRWPTQDQ